MGKKIYLSPSDQYANTYAAGDTSEGIQANRISDYCKVALERCGFDVLSNENMYEAVKESNQWGADLHVPIHTNAFNGKVSGTRIFYYNDNCTEAIRAAKAVFNVLAPFTPGTSNAIKTANLYETRNTYCPCVYIEVDFHDVESVAKWIVDHVEEIGEKICIGICNYFGVRYIEKEKSVSVDNEVYTVQAVFSTKKEALDLEDTLLGMGISCAVVSLPVNK